MNSTWYVFYYGLQQNTKHLIATVTLLLFMQYISAHQNVVFVLQTAFFNSVGAVLTQGLSATHFRAPIQTDFDLNKVPNDSIQDPQYI